MTVFGRDDQTYDLERPNSADCFPVLDTHTGGEITRVLISHDIGLDDAPPADQIQQLRGRLDWIRKSLTSEPRGSAFAVGAVVTPPSSSIRDWQVLFFNNVGYLGMCGHGLMGVVEALRYRHQILQGANEFLTPVGKVTTVLDQDRRVTFTGVPSYVYRQDVTVTCEDGTVIVGDIAYGGNWFFLALDESIDTSNHTATASELMMKCQLIRDAIDRENISGPNGEPIDHIELYCPLHLNDGSSQCHQEVGCRNFVLCPGGHYDRSPCGTGTSAKLACLARRGQLQSGQEWIQESITGSRFLASYQTDDEGVRVKISGRAHVIAETIQVIDPADPLRHGLKESLE